jgi:hypothetical protein
LSNERAFNIQINFEAVIVRTSPADSRLKLRWHRTARALAQAPAACLTIGSDEDCFFEPGAVVAFTRNVPEAIRTFAEMHAGDPNPPKPQFFNLDDDPPPAGLPIEIKAAVGVTVDPQGGCTLAFAKGWSAVFVTKTGPSSWSARGDLEPAA